MTKTSEIELKRIGKWIVYVTTYRGEFYATQGKDDGTLDEGERTKKLEAKTLAELEELIKRQESDDRHFKPIDVIAVEGGQIGRITSRVADRDTEVYFTFKPRPDHAKPTRTRERLEGYSWGGDVKHRFVKATTENLEILKAIQADQAQIEALSVDQAELRKKYKDPVTWDTIEEQGGA